VDLTILILAPTFCEIFKNGPYILMNLIKKKKSSMDICKYLWVSQYPWITRLAVTRTDIERTWISYLSNGADTNIILSAP
jgi:hypothetical protein